MPGHFGTSLLVTQQRLLPGDRKILPVTDQQDGRELVVEVAQRRGQVRGRQHDSGGPLGAGQRPPRDVDGGVDEGGCRDRGEHRGQRQGP
jgi:hypothetical protein